MLFRLKRRNQGIHKWLRVCCGKYKYGLIIIILCNSLLSLSVILTSLVIKRIIDAAVESDKLSFFYDICIFGGLFLTQIVIGSIGRYLRVFVESGLEKRIKERVYNRLLNIEFKQIEKEHNGELMNYLNSDVKVVVENLVSILPGVVATVIRITVVIFILTKWDWKLGILFLIGGISVIVCSVYFRNEMKSLHKSVQVYEGQGNAFFEESLENLVMIRSFQAEEIVECFSAKYLNEIRRAKMERNKYSNLYNTGFSGIMRVGYFIGLVWGAVGILKGDITYGTFIAVLQLVGQVQRPMIEVSGLLPGYYAMCGSVERLIELEKIPREAEGDCIERKADGNFSSLTIDDLSFSYNEKQIFFGAKLIIRNGDFIALIGKSGIGKSTFFKLLLALYRIDKGNITIENGESSHQLTKRDRKLFAYVPQENFLMSGSIYEMVSFLPRLTETEKGKVREACRVACAAEFILNMPEKYETVLGERGRGISEGQAQRLAIARAVYSESPILLLDESTSALDADTERNVLLNIKKLRNRTVLMVTHRKAVLDTCNRIIEIRQSGFWEE